MKSIRWWIITLAGALGATTATAQVPASKPAAPRPRLVQAPTEAMTQKARTLYADGLRAYEQAHFADAHAAFLAAWALEKHYTIACNLGDVETRLSSYRDAANHLRTCAEGMANDPKKTAAEKADARALFGEARKKVLSVRVRANVPVEIRADGETTSGDEIYLEPGKHTIEARADGYALARADVDGAAGEARDVALELKSVAATATATTTTTATATATVEPRSRVPAYVMGGVGLASVIAGAVLVGTAYSTNADVSGKVPRDEMGNSLCQRPPVTGADLPSCVELRRRTSEANTFANAGIGMLIAGPAVVGAGVVYFLLSRGRGDVSPVAGRVVPVAGPSGGGLMIQGAF